MSDDWRVVVFDPDERLERRLHEELGDEVEVRIAGDHVTLWFDTASEASTAAECLTPLIDDEDLASRLEVERWDRQSQTWQPAGETPPEREDPFEDPAWEAASNEVWEVVATLVSRSEAAEVMERAAMLGRTAKRRRRRVIFECTGEPAAEALVVQLRSELPPQTEIERRQAPGRASWWDAPFDVPL